MNCRIAGESTLSPGESALGPGESTFASGESTQKSGETSSGEWVIGRNDLLPSCRTSDNENNYDREYRTRLVTQRCAKRVDTNYETSRYVHHTMPPLSLCVIFVLLYTTVTFPSRAARILGVLSTDSKSRYFSLRNVADEMALRGHKVRDIVLNAVFSSFSFLNGFNLSVIVTYRF